MLYCHAIRKSVARSACCRVSAIWCVLIALAVLGQSLLVQAHAHETVPGTIAYSQAPAATSAGEPRDDDSSDTGTNSCLLCRETNQAGHYVLTPETVAPIQTVKHFWPAAPMLSALALPRRGVGWSGRAPPR